MNMKKMIIAAVAATSIFATAAYAAVTLDEGGYGFVGKGDVQQPFGWNNATAQKEANNVSFKYESTDSYDVTIEFDTGNPDKPKSVHHHIVTQEKSSSVDASVASDPRKTGQWTGWNLNGFGNQTVTGEAVPAVGDPCPNGNLGTCEVTAVSLGSSTGGLYAIHNGISKLIHSN